MIALAPHYPEDKQQAMTDEPLNWRSWTVKEWMAVLTAVGAVFAWFCRKVVRPTLRCMKNIATMPNNIADIKEKQAVMWDILVQNRARNRAILDTQRHPVWESDAGGKCVFANQFMLKLLDVPFEKLEGESWRSIIHQDDRKLVQEEWDSCIRDGRDFQLEYRWVNSSGEPIKINAHCRRVMDGKKLIGYIASVELVDHHKKIT